MGGPARVGRPGRVVIIPARGRLTGLNRPPRVIARRAPRGPVPLVVGFRGQRIGYWREPRTFFYGGRMRRLVALTAIGTLAVGTAVYYPRGYLALSRPLCSGRTDEGCELRWRDVPTEDGSVVPQCVQYCARAVQPRAVAVAQTPPAPTGNASGCEIKAFSDPELQGSTFTTSDNYPSLGEWTQQISSLQVVAGTWDFFTDDNYGGEVIRLAPGDYPKMEENWVNQISSFMCVQPDGQ
ncbi:MAG: hypothetical protein IT538_06290 [Variibacter sp.]|nr:hypothetical protein [Variibacter sp.]